MGLISKAKDGAKSSFFDSLKEGWKRLRNWLFTLLAAYILSVIQIVYGLDHMPSWSEAGTLFWHSFLNFPAFIQEWLVSTPFELISDHPILATATAILLSGYLVLVVVLIRAYRTLNRQSELIKGADDNAALLSQAGIKARYPHAKFSSSSAAWDALKQDIMSPENKFVYVLGANGIDTFGGPSSPLFNTFETFRGTVRVVLCKPDCKPMKGRALAVGITAREYKKHIQTSVKRLRFLRSKQKSVEARYYDGQPNWKLIITSQSLWVQYYLPGGPDVDQTPVWTMSMTENQDGFYHLFHMEFDRVWERCSNDAVNLN